jgi:dTDP-4-dehydrorhamnose 3,5-epimerase-like enzyme
MIEYFADNPYSPENDRSVRFDDPDIAITWGCAELILSEKDKNAPFVKDSDCNF